MSWLDSLQPAKYKGVSFFVESSETIVGRRTVQHDFPGRDSVYVEDLGRAARKYTFDAYVLGKEYHLQRDALMTVLEQPGIGQLSHPRLGDMEVQATSLLRIRETNKDGGMAVLSITFTQSEPPSTPATIINTQRGLLDQANDFIDTALQELENIYSIFQAGQAAINAVSATVNNFTVAIETAISHGKRSLDFQTALENLKNNTLSLLETATGIGGVITDLFTSDNTLDAIIENLRLQDFGDNDTTNDPNAQALNAYIRQNAVVGSCLAVSNIDFTDSQQAGQARELIGAALDTLMENSDDLIFDSLHAVYGALLKDIETRSINLPTIIEKELSDDLPSLFLSYDFYETIDQAGDIVSRNRIHHPGFCPGGVPLEVLSRG